MLPWAGLTNPACNSLFIHNGCCDILRKSVLSRLFLSSFLLYYYITVTSTPNSFLMMQRWLSLSSNPINSKLIRDPYFKVLTLICKGHLFNQDQYFTSKHLYSLIPWSQQQRHMGSDSWRQKEGEEGGVSVSCFVLFYLKKKAPKAGMRSARERPPPSTRPRSMTALLSLLSTHTSQLFCDFVSSSWIPLIWRGGDEERKMSKAKKMNERSRIQRLLLPKPSELLRDAFQFRCNET